MLYMLTVHHSCLELVLFVVVLETQLFLAASERLIHRTM